LDVAVERANDLPDALERPGEVERVELPSEVVTEWGEDRRDLGVVRRHGPESTTSIPRDHRGRPGEEVAEIVAELPLVALAQTVDRCRAVLAERHGSGAPEPHGVGAVDVDQGERGEDV